MKEYFYPDFLSGSLRLFFWEMRDCVILFLLCALGLLWLLQSGGTVPLTLGLVWGFLSLRVGDTSVKDQWLALLFYFLSPQEFYLEGE